ncbi:AGE family epimerase/isomerase [Sphingobacterium hungaricum]|uniref:Cellobiose 2-epimerase n=1 Tax=Sphingobacterium hungaricum TaxID=2082723 RepID=A0A928UTH5_9SPHI|nr:AGE family epimerase/isomerase [Sphingobacterium hungaricum]MBE8712447.1 N-acyl-D-glucosamine 2-epimerase [Sphingobacterium hungaricum]
MNEFRKELEENILPFWAEKMVDYEHGGFYGAIDGHNRLQEKANKGVVMHARILWTFSAAFRVLKKESYLNIANRAFEYIKLHFIDAKFGGVYWELDYLGNPVNKKKQTYAQGFALYAFSEYYRATSIPEALTLSKAFFEQIESLKDQETGGYWEAFTEDWQPIEDMRLSDKDENEAKTMNTHLHILEPYTNLLRIWPDQQVIRAQHELLDLFLHKIYNPKNGHLQLFFDKNWNSQTDTISYGHDIEAAWLMLEAAEVLNNTELKEEVATTSLAIALASAEGLLADGSMAYELKDGVLDKERHWWVQAEAVVGFQYLAVQFDQVHYLEYSKILWKYIQNELIDYENGEWYWSRNEGGSINRKDDKAGFWKCPYHNGRMCLEMMAFQSKK